MRPVFLIALFSLGACETKSNAGLDAGSSDSGTVDARAEIDASSALDTGVDASADDAASPTDAASDVTLRDATAGGVCSFNVDCIAEERCECSKEAGCACAPGVRGTGVNGVTECTSGNDCASALCVEGLAGLSYCSDECATSDDCGDALPICADIAFVGRICIRQPS